MQERLLAYKASVVACFAAVASFLGWQGVLLVVWIAVMALDYVSGTIAAIKNRDWCSARAREGLWHKAGMVLAVLVSVITDVILYIATMYIPIGLEWPVLITPLVVSWYIITELGSILENAVKLDAPVPVWLVAALKTSAKIIDAAGEKTIKKTEE